MSNLLSQASLVMIPSGYKEDVVYSAVPTNGNGDLSFTRASNGTRVNSAGLVEVCPWNMVEYSEDMNNQPVNVDVTVNITATTSPIGTSNGNKVSETATTNPHLIRTNKATPNGYDIVSIYAKAAERTFIQIQSWADPTSYVNFNLTTGVVSAYSVATIYGIESVGNGWYRCYANVQGSGAGIVGVGIITSGTAGWAQSYLGDTSKGVYMWGLQINTGALKPYFPTTDRLNVPRLTYQNGGGGCPSLLLEKQSTNLYLYSEDLTQWLTSGSPTVTGNDSTSPDGTTNADRVQFSASGNLVYNNGTGSAGTNTLTVYAKAKTGTAQKFRFFANGATTVSSDFTATDQWQRFEYSYTFSAVTAGLQGASTGASDVLFWGFQHEVSSYPTSYIPTTSSSATRVADACSKTGISSLIGQTEGTLFFEYPNFNSDYNEGLIGIDDGSGNNRILFYSDTNNRITAQVRTNGVTQQPASYSVSGNVKVAIAYNSTEFVFYVNGVLKFTGTAVVFSNTMSNLTYNHANLSGSITSQAILFKTRLTNAELASLTTI